MPSNMTSHEAGHTAGTLQGVLLILPITMAVMGLVVLVPVLPTILAHFKDVPGVEAQVGLMLTLPALCVALLSPIAGLVVDFFGRRKTLLGALLLYAFFGTMPLYLESLSSIIASRFALGVTEALVVISSTTLIGDYFHGEAREKWLSYQTAIASLSSVLLAILGGALGSTTLGWRGPFAAYGISILIAIALLIWTWEPERSEEPAEATGTGRFPWGAVVPVALLAIFGGLMFFTMQIQVSNVLSDYYQMKSAGDIGFYSGIAGLCVAIGTLLYKQFTAKRGVPTQLLVAFGLLGISYFMMNHAPTSRQFTGWLMVNQFGAGMLLPALVVWAMARLPFEFRGRGTGLFMSGWWLGQPISAQAVPLLRGEMGGSLPATLQLLGILCLVAAGIALIGIFRATGSRANAV